MNEGGMQRTLRFFSFLGAPVFICNCSVDFVMVSAYLVPLSCALFWFYYSV